MQAKRAPLRPLLFAAGLMLGFEALGQDAWVGPSLGLAGGIATGEANVPDCGVAEPGSPPPGCPEQGADAEPFAHEAPPQGRRPWTRVLAKSLGAEAKRYGQDTVALLRSPLSWDSRDRQKAAGFVLVLGGLLLADREIDREAQTRRSDWTDRVSGATTSLGGGDGMKLSAALLAGGLLFRSDTTRDAGREALEASILTMVISKYVLKPAFGRKRPEETDGETVFRSFSHHSSFPSGHATQAFAIASVLAARSSGWVVPTLAYTAATLVAFSRVNDRAHFASDVFAGAVLGATVGNFIVNRHRRQEGVERSTVLFDLVPGKDGLAVQLRF